MPKKETKIHRIKLAPPPPELPIYGQVDSRRYSFFGRTNYEARLEEKKFIFGIKRTDRKRHIYMIGKSGMGKSKLLELLIRQDIAYGYGLCLIDPHGDVVEKILDFIPENRINDVVLIDPTDTKFPISFNPFQSISQELRYQTVQGLVEVFKKQFNNNWNSQLEHIIRFTILALLDYPEGNIKAMVPMLTDKEYREKVIEHIKDNMVRKFWEFEFTNWAKKFEIVAITPLVSKLDQFFSNHFLNSIFIQKENKIDFNYLINSQKIILISLSKGKLGEDNSAFLGSMFINKIYQAGLSRSAVPENERKDFYLYVDGFHNLITDTFEDLFSEANKYGFCITISHQYMAQLPIGVIATILGNVGTIIVFRISGDDARKLALEMSPIFQVQDMINLGARQFFIKITIEGETFDPFSAETLSVLPPTHLSFKNVIKEKSRSRYSSRCLG